jgi:hypothetical protein
MEFWTALNKYNSTSVKIQGGIFSLIFLYKNLDLEQLGVQELNAVEVKGTDGGHMVGYSKW